MMNVPLPVIGIELEDYDEDEMEDVTVNSTEVKACGIYCAAMKAIHGKGGA